ncbi:MAG TPA: protease pro-enzyme activation domain-containing protein, partial [Candidatus Dormibacteraeota bacterium]
MKRLLWLAATLTVAVSVAPALSVVDAAGAPVTVGAPPTVVLADRTGDVPPAAPIQVQLVLKRQNQGELDAILGQASRPRLTVAQAQARYAPSPASVAAATSFLRSHGFNHISVSADQTLVDAEATAGVVQAALSTRLGRYRDRVTGKTFRSNLVAPALPAALAAQLVAVHGLTDRPAARRSAVQRASLGPGGGYTPNDLQSLYALHNGVLGSTDGSGITIGLLEFSTFQLGHIATYDSQYGITPGPLVVIPAGVLPDLNCCGSELEAELDIEVIHALAPKSTIKVYESANDDTDMNSAYTKMVQDGVTVISTSWGLCEQQTAPGELGTLNQIFQGAALAGINTYAATGDLGAYDCRNPIDPNDAINNPLYNTRAVDSPASDPNVIGVGGTRLISTGDNVTYSSETAWSEPAASPTPEGGGGGLSTVYPAPSWQAGTGVASAMRQLPDISFDADPASGISVFTYPSTATTASDPGAWGVVGGTSAGAPAWAAFNALYNQYSASAGGGPLPSAGSALYRASACRAGLFPYHDVTTGNNLYYSAGPGFDLASGLGSMNGADLAATLHALATGTATLAITAVAPARGPATGVATLTILGCGFVSTPTVTFGGVPSPQVTWFNSTTLRATLPAHAPGSVDVVVTNPGNAQATLPQGFHYNRPAGHQQLVTNTDGRLEMFVTGQNNLVYHAWEASPSSNFGRFYSLGGPSTGNFVSDPSAGVNPDGRIEAFAIGSDGAVWHAWQFAPGSGWTPFYSLGGATVGRLQGVVAVTTNTDGRLEIFSRGSDGSIWHAWQTSPNGGWGRFYSLGRPGGGSFVSDVAAGRNGDGRLEISAIDPGGTVWHAWQTTPSGGWTGFYPLSGRAVAGTPGINTNQDGRLEIFARAANDGSIVHSWQLQPSGGWGSW